MDTSLAEGQAQLVSYISPLLFPGNYDIDISQHVSSLKQPSQNLKDNKILTITGPPLTKLSEGAVHSTYPPEGQSIESCVLPNIVLQDCHLPWEQNPYGDGFSLPPALNDQKTPWLALLIFSGDEITSYPTLSPPLEPSASFAVTMNLAALKNALPATLRSLSDNECTDATASADFVFIKSSTFNSYFKAQVGDEKEPGLGRYAYLSHIRRVKPDMGEARNYAIVLSHRTGPPALTKPQTAHAHLVSLKGIQRNIQYPVLDGKTVALVSLQSWSFQWIPSGDTSFYQSLTNMSHNIRPLRWSDEDINKINVNGNANQTVPNDAPWLQDRLRNGFNFVNHRLRGGESSLSLYRGPLIPNRPNEDAIPFESTFHGEDNQIVDERMGILDVSYQVAWELGKSLASVNTAYFSALARIRKFLNPQKAPDDGIHSARAEIISAVKAMSTGEWFNSWRPEDSTQASRTPPIISANTQVQAGKKSTLPSFSLSPEELLLYMARELAADRVYVPTMGCSGASDAIDQSLRDIDYSDLTTVIDFICTKLLTLDAIPYNYLFPQAEVVGVEGILTFYVDNCWMDCLVDGALSVGNLLADEFLAASIKQKICRAVNEYLTLTSRYYTPSVSATMVPVWGLVMRGAFIQAFPDLRIRAPWAPYPGVSATPRRDAAASDPDLPPEIVVSKRLSKDFHLCLFDRTPDYWQSFYQGITISQPPHQQQYCIGDSLNSNELCIRYTYVPTSGTVHDAIAKVGTNDGITFTKAGGQGLPVVYDWDTQLLNIYALATNYNSSLLSKLGPGLYNPDTKPSAAYVGVQLSDKTLELQLETKGFLRKPDGKPRKINSTSFDQDLVERTPSRSQDEINLISEIGLLKQIGKEKPKQPISSGLEDLDVEIISKPNSIAQSHLEKACFALSADGKTPVPANYGSKAIDILFTLLGPRIHETEKILENLSLMSVQVRFPIGFESECLISPEVLPRVRFVGRGCRWVVASSKMSTTLTIDGKERTRSEFVVQLTPRDKGKVAGADLSFVINDLMLNPKLKKGMKIEIPVIEEYNTASVDGAEKKVVDIYKLPLF